MGKISHRLFTRQYRNYDLCSGYKVVLNNYHGRRPYTNFKIIKREVTELVIEDIHQNMVTDR
jgi:hypothetical protein